jgi:hypothetical protein
VRPAHVSLLLCHIERFLRVHRFAGGKTVKIMLQFRRANPCRQLSVPRRRVLGSVWLPDRSPVNPSALTTARNLQIWVVSERLGTPFGHRTYIRCLDQTTSSTCSDTFGNTYKHL